MSTASAFFDSGPVITMFLHPKPVAVNMIFPPFLYFPFFLNGKRLCFLGKTYQSISLTHSLFSRLSLPPSHSVLFFTH
jgi:hypothetical protein